MTLGHSRKDPHFPWQEICTMILTRIVIVLSHFLHESGVDVLLSNLFQGRS
jgi:hypothetical protein